MLSDLGTNEDTNRIIEFIKTRNNYYANAEKLIAQGEIRRASEMLWRAITQTVKALDNIKYSNN